MLSASFLKSNSLLSHTLPASLAAALPNRKGRRKCENTFLAMIPLFFQTETIESIVLLLPLCTLLLMGDFAVDRDGRFLNHEEKGISRRQTDATR